MKIVLHMNGFPGERKSQFLECDTDAAYSMAIGDIIAIGADYGEIAGKMWRIDQASLHLLIEYRDIDDELKTNDLH